MLNMGVLNENKATTATACGGANPPAPNLKFIYCRGGDKTAPMIAQSAGILYGIRYDYPLAMALVTRLLVKWDKAYRK